MKLHALRISSRCSAVGMALDAAGIDYELVFHEWTDLKAPEFLAKNPTGKVPALETPEGVIFETHAILRYIARASGKLYGSSNIENSHVDQWLDWINGSLQTLSAQFIYQIFGFEGIGLNYEKGSLFKAKKTYGDNLALIEAAIGTEGYIVGNDVTVADIALTNAIIHYWTFILAEKERKAFPNIARWLGLIAETHAFKKWWGRIRAVPSSLNWPAFEAPAPAPAPKKEEKKAAPEPAPAAPKEEKKEQKFPETTFNLPAFKTEFINEPDRTLAVDNFFKSFDANGWSIFHLKYILYKNENEVLFKFNNLVKGFLRSCETIGKFVFGTHQVFGEEPHLVCEGVWLMQGTDILDALKESDTFDTYVWTKLDHTKDSDKAIVAKFWNCRKEDEDSIEGLGRLRTFKWIK